MMERMTLREVREALAAARARGTKVPATSPTVEELESLGRLLEREAEAGAPAENHAWGAAEPGAEANGEGRRGSRRSAPLRGSGHRRA